MRHGRRKELQASVAEVHFPLARANRRGVFADKRIEKFKVGKSISGENSAEEKFQGPLPGGPFH
jgi:hypothetical protein